MYIFHYSVIFITEQFLSCGRVTKFRKFSVERITLPWNFGNFSLEKLTIPNISWYYSMGKKELSPNWVQQTDIEEYLDLKDYGKLWCMLQYFPGAQDIIFETTCILKQHGDICLLNSICELSCHTATHLLLTTHGVVHLYPGPVSMEM